MADDLSRRLRSATGAGDRFCITVLADGSRAPVAHEFNYPYAIVGRGEGCDIILPDPEISFRHAYLQVIEGRVFCVDLASRNGVRWPDGPRKFGWLLPEGPITIGPYRLQVHGETAAKGAGTSHAVTALNPLERYRGEVGDMPKVDLEFHYETEPASWTVNRLLTLLGRSPLCKLRFEATAVSAVHCALLLTQQGLWAIDLLGRGGTQVDGGNIRAMPLENGHEVKVAAYRIGVFYQGAADSASADRLTDHAAESDTSMDLMETAFFNDSPGTVNAPPSAPAPAQTPPAAADPLDWRGSIFRLEVDGTTLIIVPLVEGAGFRYQQLHVEANALQRKFEMKQFVNLVVDLSNLNYFGSELIGVLIRLARTVTNGNGRAAMSGPSQKMLEVLETMRLTKLWPIYASLEDALKHVKE